MAWSPVDEKLRLTVRSGGHCYEGWVSENDGVIVDVSSLRAAGRDDSQGWYYLDSGCTNWDLYNQLYRQYGVTLPAGSCYSVGAGGHICGGGYGLLSRLHGLTVDWLYGVEVVCVDADGRARSVRATRDSTDPREVDLLWGHTGGGGGNFGIITRYLFRELPQAPSEAWLASFSWEWSELEKHPDQFFRIFANYGSFFAEHSGVDSPYASLFALLHLTRKAAEQVTLTVQNAGSDRAPLDAFIAAMQEGLDTSRVRIVAPRVAVNGFYREMYGPRGPWPDATMDGCYVNYCDSDLEDWQYLYYKDNYPRLRRVKQQWDPRNIFHHGQSIELP